MENALRRRSFTIKKETLIRENKAKFKEFYKMQKEPMGSGGFGTVYKCRHRETKQTRAVKVIPKKKIKNMESFMHEVHIMQKLDHPNVLKLYEYFIDDSDVYLVTEICKGGELFDRIVEKEFYPEPEAAVIFE